MNIKNLFVVLVLLCMGGCSPKPKPIAYGSDGCHFCRMTIVDALHASEIVTKKGKIYKFDAVECMVNYSKELDPDDVALYLCNHYTAPKELVDATTATFLISEKIPSPMGEFLTAFKTKTEAFVQQQKDGGELLTWDEVLIALGQ